MEQVPNYGDDRQSAFCPYCSRPLWSGVIETTDHVPSRVLLDDPLLPNLPTVRARRDCNGAVSVDEEYVACLIECARLGTAPVADLGREKVRRILRSRPALAARLADARTETGGIVRFQIEVQRVRNVLLKLARGHALFELNEPQPDEPSALSFAPLASLSEDTRQAFEQVPQGIGIWPEVGSRAMQRLVALGDVPWITVQPGRYRYLACADDGVVVRIVLSEYLAGEVVW